MRIWCWYLKISYVNYKIKQIGVGIEISSYLLQNEVLKVLVNLKVLLIWSDLPLHSPVSWNRQKIIGFQQEEFFLITILAKGSILDVWQGSKNTNEYGCKILAKRLLMTTGKRKNKGVHWHEKGYVLSAHSRLHCIPFPLIFQAPSFFSFSSLHFIIHSIGTAIVKNKCCVFLESTLNGFCFIGNSLSVSSNSDHLRRI